MFIGELMFALETGGEIYLKADAQTVGRFEEAGSRPFVYTKDGRTVRIGYWLLPDAAVDDPDEASRWARLAVEAAQRAACVKNAKSRVGQRRRADPRGPAGS